MIGRSVRHLRRWGLGWFSIFKCVIGLHGRGFVKDRALVCARCGRVLVKATPAPQWPDPAQGGVHPEEAD